MIVTLTEPDGGFVRDVELPENLPVRPECIALDGVPYVLDLGNNGKYRRMVGVWKTRSKPFEIPIAYRVTEPQTFEIASSRWVTGSLATVKIRYIVKAVLPWGQTQDQHMEDTRPVVLNGVWCPMPERPYPDPDAGTLARRLANKFANVDRVKGSRLVATVLAIDEAGRMVVEVDKHQPAFGAQAAVVWSMKKAMLESPAFVPAVWRMA